MNPGSVHCWSYNGPRYCHCCLDGNHHHNGRKCTWQQVCESLTHLTQKISRFSCFYFEVMKFTLQKGRGCQNTHLPHLHDQRQGLTLGMGQMLEVKLNLFFFPLSLSLSLSLSGTGRHQCSLAAWCGNFILSSFQRSLLLLWLNRPENTPLKITH